LQWVLGGNGRWNGFQEEEVGSHGPGENGEPPGRIEIFALHQLVGKSLARLVKFQVSIGQLRACAQRQLEQNAEPQLIRRHPCELADT
jgi:hypothetical protein